MPSILAGIDLSLAQDGRDFGRGFYTTTLLRQASFWAENLANRTRAAHEPAVIAFDVDLHALSRLDSIAFARGAFDADAFWSFVWHCRQRALDHGRDANGGWYDLVVGPVAAAWRQRAQVGDYDQLSFHTDRAVSLLNGSRSRRVR
ncbi:MAG: DUF3990 domain-containing protein [Chloroflexota bacterium]